MPILGIDIGGSAIKSGLVDGHTGKLQSEVLRLPVSPPLDPAQLEKALAQCQRHFDWNGPVGIGFPGRIVGGIVAFVGNISPAFVGLDLHRQLRHNFCSPPTFLNDADAAGIAEFTWGLNQNKPGLSLFLTLGTGIGSAMFLNGQLIPGTELGQLEFKGMSADNYVAASAIHREGLTFDVWSLRLQAYLRHLDQLFCPRLIILGGAIAESIDTASQKNNLRTELRCAQHGNSAGLIGAARHAMHAEVAPSL